VADHSPSPNIEVKNSVRQLSTPVQLHGLVIQEERSVARSEILTAVTREDAIIFTTYRAIWSKFVDVSEDRTVSVFGVEKLFQQQTLRLKSSNFAEDTDPEYKFTVKVYRF
jgi:hypothetical protein